METFGRSSNAVGFAASVGLLALLQTRTTGDGAAADQGLLPDNLPAHGHAVGEREVVTSLDSAGRQTPGKAIADRGPVRPGVSLGRPRRIPTQREAVSRGSTVPSVLRSQNAAQ
jgi:hypothetical protein